LANLDKFVKTGYRVLVGPSRKKFIGKITGKENPVDRTFGTAGAVSLCADAGASIVRVHDVAEMMDVIKIVQVIRSA
jgi:dihydropteroate synthase